MTIPSVTEHPAGTMSEAERQAIASQTDKDKNPDGTSKVSSENTPKYTETELKAAVHAVRSETGREKKSLEAERDGYKTKLEAKESELSDNTAEIDKLQAKFDALSEGDPDKFDVAKELKAVREERRQLKADRHALEVEKTAHGEQVKLATDTLMEMAIWEIASEYETGDPVKLKDLCDTFTATSEEQIRKVADTLWTKKPTEPVTPEVPPVIPYSGKTEGGGQLTEQDKLDRRYPTMKKK